MMKKASWYEMIDCHQIKTEMMNDLDLPTTAFAD